MIGSSKVAVNTLDVYGAQAIGAGYAGTSIAPVNGLIVQGNVGIGTNNPMGYALNVNGTIAATSFVGNGSGLTGVGSGIVNAGSTGQVAYYPGNGTQIVGTSTINIANGNVGIGTSSPAYKLTIGGVAGTDGIKFPDATTQTTGVPTCPLGDNPVSCGGYWVCSSQRPVSCFIAITLSPSALATASYGVAYDQIITASGEERRALSFRRMFTL